MKFVKQSLLSVVVAAGLASAGAHAADESTQGMKQDMPKAPTTMPQQSAPPMDVSDEQVGDFVEAYVAVQTLNQEYATKLQASTDDPEKSQELQQEAQTEMSSAITDAGLSMDEYKQIAMAANQSEQLRQRISMEIEEVTSASDS
ncbi:DUF4168 domain-containing protein [Gilvimarinus agarilyticus]|uniref:DUF4168 domain-containing protein n=1 Tax=Gilvimarinus agarilyticus TaxID=679259 RepID=UPI00069623E8|nr:DUF4168 domain-containing protein [Gilvimarinus agarilyticus]